MSTTVVHWNDRPEGSIYIGRGTPFGNPYVVNQAVSRAEAIARYREYFYAKLERDPAFSILLERLRGRVLACHCKPMDCHGDVIAEYLNRA